MSILMAALGSLGFGILLRMRLRHLPLATLGGTITWIIYLLFSGMGTFAATLIAAFAGNVWALMMAHLRKAPAIIFMITAMVPLIPGSGLYYTMKALVHREYMAGADLGVETLLTAAAIGFGSLLCTTGVTIFSRLRDRKDPD